MAAAIKFLSKKGLKKIIVAVPIAAASTARRIRNKVDELIAVSEIEALSSVGAWYDDFSQVSDDEVKKLLNRTSPDLNAPGL